MNQENIENDNKQIKQENSKNNEQIINYGNHEKNIVQYL